MRDTAIRVWVTLCAGRAPRNVAVRLGVGLGLTVVLWSGACAFLLMEPVA